MDFEGGGPIYTYLSYVLPVAIHDSITNEIFHINTTTYFCFEYLIWFLDQEKLVSKQKGGIFFFPSVFSFRMNTSELREAYFAFWHYFVISLIFQDIFVKEQPNPK